MDSLHLSASQDGVHLESLEEGRLMSIMQARSQRLLPEPTLDEAHVFIFVRHPHLGTKSRLFHENAVFQLVYDWIGSLAPEPENFEIRDHAGLFISPNRQCFTGTFNMNIVNSPVQMSPSGTVSFTGYSTNQCSTQDKYTELQKRKEQEREKITKEVIFEVNRNNIYNDMIALYRKRNIMLNCVKLTFKDENAIGDGVSRDAYSEFFQAVYQKMEGEFVKIPANRLDDDDLEIIGKIIHHAFVLYDIFPMQLSKAAFQYYLFDNVDKNDLVESFLGFITPTEREMIENFGKDSVRHKQAVMDILSDYSIFENPTDDNLTRLLEMAANIALIRQPCYPMRIIVSGMGPFWKNLECAMIQSLYFCNMASAEDIISSLEVVESNNQDRKITTWLHRYIRSCSRIELGRFLRFVTGAETTNSKSVIKVQYVNPNQSNQSHPHPFAQTCFRILILPRSYSSFHHLKENMNIYINNPENWAVNDDMSFES